MRRARAINLRIQAYSLDLEHRMAQEFSISSAPSTPSGSKETHHALQPAGDDAQHSQSTTSSTKASSKKLSFREHLFDQADSLFAPAPGMTDAGNLKRTLEDFSDMLRDLAQIEEKYAADLDRVAKKERRVCGDVPSVDEAFDAVRGMLANRADQGKLMAEQVLLIGSRTQVGRWWLLVSLSFTR